MITLGKDQTRIEANIVLGSVPETLVKLFISSIGYGGNLKPDSDPKNSQVSIHFLNMCLKKKKIAKFAVSILFPSNWSFTWHNPLKKTKKNALSRKFCCVAKKKIGPWVVSIHNFTYIANYSRICRISNICQIQRVIRLRQFTAHYFHEL